MANTHETIASRVATLQAGMAGQLPADVGTAFAAEQTDLLAAGVPAGVPAVGTPFPAAQLLDATGLPTTAAAVVAGRPAVIVFYRGAWCPYCNVAVRTYQEQLEPELDHRGIALVAISPQTPDGSLTMREEERADLPGPVRPGQPDRHRARHPHRTVQRRPGRSEEARPRPHRRQRRRLHRPADAHRRPARRRQHDPLDRRAHRLHRPHRAGRRAGRGGLVAGLIHP